MIKKINPAILIAVNFMFLHLANGQINMNVPDNLRQRFINYCKSVPREEIFVHSDREEYIAGENLWFNVYLLDRQSFKPSISRIAYFELLNSGNRPVVQKRILIEKGFGPGQITIPDTLSSGRYTIRVYTNWMRNFLPYNCFVKNISIYNALTAKAFKGKLQGAYISEKGNSEGVAEKFKYSGINLRINNSKQEILEIFVDADNKFRSENNNLFYVFIQTRGNINFVSTVKMTEETARITVPGVLLSEGINEITIFNSKSEPVVQRLIYTHAKEKDLPALNSIDSCKKRSKISLEIELGADLSTPFGFTNLSVSVAPKMDDRETMGIKDYMVFGTEYGPISRSAINRRNIDELPSEVMDSILSNVRSNWINWGSILSGDLPDFKYRVESEDHFLPGKLLISDPKADNSSENVLLCTPGKEAVFQYATTDREGNFIFNLHIDEQLKDLIIMPDDASKNHKIIIESSFSDKYLKSEILTDSVIRQITPDISLCSVNYQVMKIYGVTSIGSPTTRIIPPLKPLRFYGKPDIELIMADYIKLPVMQEVFFELLPHVTLKKKKSDYEISIADRVDDNRYVTLPSLMIDGVIIRDPAFIVNLDPEIVERIDVIKGKYLVGNYFFYGLINLITKSGDFSSITLPDYMIRLPYKVIDSVNSFISPDYSSVERKASRIPDFRNTLYWNPSVKPDTSGKAKIEFWSSDVVSDYEINIQGITPEGKLISVKKSLKVY